MAGVLERIKTIGEYRDAALVLISVDYLLGYFSWSVYAAKNDLGLVPALDTQYLVAGVLPTVILGIGIAPAIFEVDGDTSLAQTLPMGHASWLSGVWALRLRVYHRPDLQESRRCLEHPNDGVRRLRDDAGCRSPGTERRKDLSVLRAGRAVVLVAVTPS
jgi:hypothetical protein